MIPLAPRVFAEARRPVAVHAYHTPLMTSHSLSEATGFDVRLKAELFQRTGSYKLRGALNKLHHLSKAEKSRGVISSSAGNHAQGLALAAALNGIKATLVMAENATPSKIAATKGYGAEVILHGTIWDEADAKARELASERGLTFVHPFDDLDLIAGQGTLGLEIYEDWPETGIVLVPIGGGGLISGVSMALKGLNPKIQVVGVESSGAPAMMRSLEAGRVVPLEDIQCSVDGLRVRRVGDNTFSIVQKCVDEIILVPDSAIFSAMLWTWSRCKLLVEGAAAATVAALLSGNIKAPGGTRVVCVLSGGNVDLDRLNGWEWN